MTELINNTQQKTRIGELLIKRNVITQEQLDQALKKQEQETVYLGELLIRLGFVEEKDIVSALVVQCNLPYIAIRNYTIDQNVLDSISLETASKYSVLPLDRVGDVLSVVMVDPLSDFIKDVLHKETNCTIAPLIATRSEIEEAIERWYR